MVRYTDEANAIIQEAGDFAKNTLKHSSVQNLHVLWAVYNHEPKPKILAWLEVEEVDEDMVRAEFAKPDFWIDVDVADTSEDLNDNGDGDTINLSPEFQRFMEMTALMSKNGVVDTKDIVRGMLTQGENKASLLLSRCSGNKLQPIDVGVPSASSINASARKLRESVTFSPEVAEELSDLRATSEDVPVNRGKAYMPVDTDESPFMDATSQEGSLKSALRGTSTSKYTAIKDGSALPANVTKSLTPGGISDLSLTGYSNKTAMSDTSQSIRILPGGKSARSLVAFRNIPTAGRFAHGGARLTLLSTKPQKSFVPERLVDIDKGTSFTVRKENFLDSNNRIAKLDITGAVIVNPDENFPLARGNTQFFGNHRHTMPATGMDSKNCALTKTNNQVGMLGGAWRSVLKMILVTSSDEVNNLMYTRTMQLFLPFMTGYESYILAGLIEAYDQNDKHLISQMLEICFRNRNISRVLVQQMSRFDIFWHWSTQVGHNRTLDKIGRIPFVGFGAFPGSENALDARTHARNSILRVVLGKGNWFTRFITGREGLQTDDKNAASQNLAAETSGFETANRNQFGTYFGRQKTNEFRAQHRLPTDESLVRTFISNPGPSMVNNGIEHTLRVLAKHWHNMNFQPSGNFAHQRMEQINAFEIMRFHMPVVFVTLTVHRGLNRWDATVLAKFIRKLQLIEPAMDTAYIKELIEDCVTSIVDNVCGGIKIRADALKDWLQAIKDSLPEFEKTAQEVYKIVSSVEIGLRLGHDLISSADWRVPSNKVLSKAIIDHIGLEEVKDIDPFIVQRALVLLAPRDKRTMIELIKDGKVKSKPADLLLRRTTTLLQREIRRDAINTIIKELSKGDHISTFEKRENYWIEDEDGTARVYYYAGKETGVKKHKFIDKLTGYERWIESSTTTCKIRTYIPVAESITRVQKAYMNIECDYGTTFTLNGLMEFSYLRKPLRNMIVLSQITCEALDDARLNVLKDIQASKLTSIAVRDLVPGRLYYVFESERNQYEPFHCDRVYDEDDEDWEVMAKKPIVTVPPQSMIVIGGGPTGLVTTIHNLENVLTSGGTMRLYEARDSFTKGGATFERAQIVRLDARWIAMMRYHLGSIFEEVFYPATGETDSHRGNTLPTQGFVEITIKDLEAMLHAEVCRLLSSKLLQHDTNSGTNYDLKTNSLQKAGKSLKKDDLIFHQVDKNGNKTNEMVPWKVTGLEYNVALKPDELVLGEEYSVYVYKKQKIHTFKLTSKDIGNEQLNFQSMDDTVENLEKVSYNKLPTVYRKGIDTHNEIKKVFLECSVYADDYTKARDELDYAKIENDKFALDIQNTHVVEATGKPASSNVHFRATTAEPYGVCCISGLKISLGMHNFGSKRWGEGIIDDIRSQSDQNTRIIGDFTKNVKTSLIAERMHKFFTRPKDENWRAHFATFVSDSQFDIGEPITDLLTTALKEYAKIGQDCRRPFLQTRFFETGDFFYLGMEFTREYDSWKNKFTDDIVTKIERRSSSVITPRDIGRFKGGLNHNIDRLWFDATLESIRLGDVYNPGARSRVPHLYLIDSSTSYELSSLPIGEAFLVGVGVSQNRYEVVLKEGQITCRNVEGYLENFDGSTMVRRAGNLARGPDGIAESKVALATFPVAHYVNFRCMRLNNIDNGYSFAFIGDEQATPHFMRYSGLTGACINGYLFNKFIGRAIAGVPYIVNARQYTVETNWSNGEVVQRGTGANYGVDGFLRPGFAYAHGLDYLRSKVIEGNEFDQNFNFDQDSDEPFLSRDWKIKFSAAWVPKRLEMDINFMDNIRGLLKKAIHEQLISEIGKDGEILDKPHEILLKKIFGEIENSSNDPIIAEDFWNEAIEKMGKTDQRVIDFHVPIAMLLEKAVDEILDFARLYYVQNKRISSEYEHQPKSVDFISDDFAVQAQNFTSSLTLSSTLSAAALTLLLVADRDNMPQIGSAILSAFTPFIAFGSITNASQYKTRNEMSREVFRDERYLPFLQEVFSCMKSEDQTEVPLTANPFYREIHELQKKFIEDCTYYNLKASGEFNQSQYEPTPFTNAFRTFANSPGDDASAADFLLILQTKLIPSVFHENSYIQQTLTDLTVVLKRLIEYNRRKSLITEEATKSAKVLFERAILFESRLDGSLQRGHVKWGFFKSRKLLHGHLWTSLVQYWWDKIYLARPGKIPKSTQEARGRGKSTMRPISAETIEIRAQTDALIKELPQSETGGLKRSTQDLQQFYHASKESYVASLIAVSGTLSFITGIIFTIGNIGAAATNSQNRGFKNLVRLGTVSFGLITPITALLAMLHLWRKFWILYSLSGKLGNKLSNGNNDNIKTIISVTRSQELVTLMRFIASAGAAVALYSGFAAREGNADLGTAPAWIGFGSLALHLLSVVYLLFIEYFIRYKFDPRLGEYLSESFREEVVDLYNAFSMQLTNANTNQDQELLTWEYVAREFLHDHRFDTVFAADRFSALYYFLQSGLSGIATVKA